MVASNTPTMRAEMFGEVKKNWGWMLALGILLVILGVIGLGMTVLLTIASVSAFGVLLLIGSGFQLVDAFKSTGWKSVTLHVFIAILYLITGAIMIYDPVGAGIALTLVLSAMLIAVGAMRVIMAFQMRPYKGWGWVAFSGVLSVILGVLVLMKWPATGLWVIGMFVAIELIFQGWSHVVIAMAAKATKDVEAAETGTPSGAAPA